MTIKLYDMDRTELLDRFLEKSDFDGYLIRDDSISNTDLYYLTDFEASDPFVYLRKNEKSWIVVPQLEYSRAKDEASVDKVISTSRYLKGESQVEGEKTRIVKELIEEQNIEKIALPENFPLKLARELEQEGIDVEPIENKIKEAREIKDRSEIEKIREVQQITEQAMKHTEKIIRDSEVKKGLLWYGGKKLTSERLRSEIKKYLIERGCDLPQEIIASSGRESAKPHSTGSGPIKTAEPILVDIFPRRKRYFGDMSRTFVKGELSREIQEMEEAVKEAQEAGFKLLENGAGTTAGEVHNAVCEVIENYGYETNRNQDAETGFIHSTGHGVGLDLHEPPRIADNSYELKKGTVLTVEPGLYLPEAGGLRLEDMVLVKKKGYENFNSMHKDILID